MPHRFFVSVLIGMSAIITALFSGCATGGGGSYRVSKAGPPSSVSFAVAEFSAANHARLSAGDQGVRDFEKFYFPAQLTNALRTTPGASAYFTMAPSPATDFVVDGVVQQSTGKNLVLQISLKRVDGSRVFSKTYSLNHEDARERIFVPKTHAFFSGIARDLAATARTTNVDLVEARAKAYAEDGKLRISPTTLDDARSAGTIERESILTPLTSALLPRAKIASQVYTQWQAMTIPLEKDKRLARYEQNLATAGSMVALTAAGASTVQGYQAASQGNQLGMQQANRNMTQAQTIMINTEGARMEAQNREQAIIKALAAYKQEFASGLPRQVTVRIYNKLLTLNGSQEQMLTEFKKVVKDKLHANP